MKEISEKLLDETLAYIQSQPYKEVAGLMSRWAECLKEPKEPEQE